ncbi:HAMP domain-containing methyl-accepting chemotaxis protein [Bradyrhizobium sp. BWC-3-1]|uniref:methyl-accepting chemotaxis protein n=1 Tax=Bradyrhizobium sp. BWC-3-1 TaxID=3080012 RepID=UPI00293F37AC|nr:HAMP domain-containing methyl-accepting chemotaxis protein [Bradyrhizobium sp. BWC-3-1]WOH60193.1 HAMP domain-containing methyl-accepting chemotaxis protein [Bradyrhizobium sp. BWC-3-1]
MISGFAVLCAVLMAAVGCTIIAVGTLSHAVDRMVTLRTPVAISSTELVGNLYSTLAALRAYLLTGDPQAKAERAAVWKELDATVSAFDKMAMRFTNSENLRNWADAKVKLEEFRVTQSRAESIAFTSDAFPATKLLLTEAAPRADIMFAQISRMINEEEGLEATADRKRLLKAMADTRGNFAAAMAQIRTYLLSGDKAEKDKFTRPWQNFKQGLAGVAARESLLTSAQRTAFDAFTKAYGELEPMPERMFAIRDSAGWNVPVLILATDAAPKARAILDLIDGPKGGDGTRSGGIKTNQNLMLQQEARNVQDDTAFLIWIEWALLTTGLVAGGAIAFFTVRSITKPIRAMTGAMGQLANGEMSLVVPGLGRSDEIGEMAGAVQVFKDHMVEAERLRARGLENDKRAAEQRRVDMHSLADDFDAAIGEVVETVSSASTELEASASTLTATAGQVQELTVMVAAASEQASTNVKSVASAAKEMASSVNKIGRHVQESARIASDAVKQAQKTNDQIGHLAHAASRIGAVVDLINTIAGQTNLLALNATIEAARAGEAGRGFAVVASEVKALAEQTAKATDEISQQIDGMQSVTGQSVAAIKEIGDTIGKMSEIASIIASAVEEQGAATQEISRNVQQAAQGTQQVSSNITDVQRGATETGSASTQVLAAAQSLSRDSNRLKDQVSKFLESVRAA